eukprot:GHVQ01026936.1.p1 GENE.GHVQ01026936.1~~GHVQ01026936.1.p1  ORF type:complete len:190 (+),score=22.78 GHVQ01026936.1:400-969(+)
MFVKRRRLPIWKYRHSDNTNQSNVCIGGCEQCRPTRISPDSEPTSRGFFRHVDVAVETEMQSVIEIATDDNAGDLDLKPDTVFSNILCVQCDQLNIMSIQIDEAIKEASEAHNGNEDKTVGSTPPTHEPVSDNAHIEQEIERLSAKASEIRKMLDSVSEQRNQNVLESGSETPSTSESLDARSNYSDCV